MMPVTKDELTLIHYAVILPLVRKSFQRSRIQAEQSLSLHEPYLTLIDEALALVHEDLRTLKQEQQTRSIRVYKIDSDSTFSEYGYVCGRYEGQNRYVNTNLKRQTSACMERYLHGERVEPDFFNNL
ncbi:hypothetical protein JCM19039_1488 [Geomicrobium sp. JCM 19039]|nr:hypothetical protein JCM19039_1488 [Geomicrobium sp. JCM 19039]